ncbi:MAG: nucleotide exchange factor GrpE, partial [Methylomonas sp.]|nr:nucleotide exchange factor GrpE [Methylomonas sp.]
MNQPTSSQPSQSDADLIAEVLEQTQEAAATPAEPSEPAVELSASNVDIQALQSELEQTKEQAAAHWDKAVRIRA